MTPQGAEPAPLLGQFQVSRDAALRRLAGTLRRTGGDPNSGIVPALRQATLVSSDGGTPPTCTVTFDGQTNTAGVRYLASYTPAAGHVVEVLVRAGDPFILGALA
jgi:hypothetical protein